MSGNPYSTLLGSAKNLSGRLDVQAGVQQTFVVQKCYARFFGPSGVGPQFAQVYFDLRMVEGIPTFSVNVNISAADVSVWGVVLIGQPVDYDNDGVPNDPDSLIISQAQWLDPTMPNNWVVEFDTKVVVTTSG